MVASKGWRHSVIIRADSKILDTGCDDPGIPDPTRLILPDGTASLM